jgi:sugar lactone lactonase YvrE
MRALSRMCAVAGVAMLAYLLAWPVSIEPLAWTPPPNPGFTGAYAVNDALAEAELLLENVGRGPEDVARGPDGKLYTGFNDGRIVRFDPDTPSDVEEFANTGGYPLGMQFAPNGHLVVADPLKGLLSITPEGSVSVLADSVDGERMLFVDDVAVAADGSIWFSDASQRFGVHDGVELMLERAATGRLLVYDPQARQAKVRLDGLSFANGVALGPGDAFVLVNESLAYRVRRLWLTGEKAGTDDVFIDELPALPDNISFNGRDRFWVAHFLPRSGVTEMFADKPLARKAVYRLQRLLPEGEPTLHGFILGLDLDGNVVANLQDTTGHVGFTTSANEYDGHLYIGSFVMPALARVPVP